MTQDITLGNLVRPETLMAACTWMLGCTTNKVKTLLDELTTKEAAETKANKEKSQSADQETEERRIYFPFEADFIEEYPESVDIPENILKWIVPVQDVHIEYLFSKNSTEEYRCISATLKFIHREEFEIVYKHLAANSTTTQKESAFRRFLIRRYNLAGYETLIYQNAFEVRTIVQPEFVKDIADKYNIYFQKLNIPAFDPYARTVSESIQAPVKPELWMEVATSLFDVPVEKIEDHFCKLEKAYPAFKGYKAREYPEDADTTNGIINWLFILKDLRIQCVYPCESEGRCESVTLHFNSRTDFRKVRNLLSNNGIQYRERSLFQRWIIRWFGFPRYEQWLYGVNLVVYTAEQPYSLTDQFHIHFSRE
ncbi:MAG: hypothetical protein LIP08_01765 [Bacteroides sp.]|nr:hypothetical protein [Bacteroides sp.]